MSEDAGATVENGGDEAASSGLDFGPLMERMDELSSGFGELTGRFDQFEQQFDDGEEPQGGDDPWAELFGQEQQEVPPEQAPSGADQRQFVQALASAAQASTQQQVQQIVGPLVDQVQQLQGHLAAQDLESRYADFRDQRVVDEVIPMAEGWAQKLGAPQMARHPVLVELAYLAHKTTQAAQSEVPAGDEHEGLEVPGGVPHQRSEPDVQRGIVAAGQGFNPWSAR